MQERRDGTGTPVEFAVFRVAWGWCAAARTKRGLCRFALPVRSRAAAERAMMAAYPAAKRRRSAFGQLIREVRRCFRGAAGRFDGFDLDLSGGSKFQKSVWRAIRRIPRGETRSYRWVGAVMRRLDASRAVGAAAGANPLPLIIPCHRVVGRDGSLTGFSAEGGVGMKARMLASEGVPLTHDGGRVRVSRNHK